MQREVQTATRGFAAPLLAARSELTEEWMTEGRTQRGRPRLADRAPLTRTRIVTEALSMVDEEGVSGLTMRGLAARIGVEAMSLYAYVTSKDDLLNAVADRLVESLVLPDIPRPDWQGRVRAVVAVWAAMEEAHPAAFPLLYRPRRGTERELAITEELMDALTEAGFDGAGVALAYQTLVSFLDGALLQWPRSAWRAPSNWREISSSIDGIRYPRVAATAPYAAQLSWDDVFNTGLDLLMRGLENLRAAQQTLQAARD